MRSKMHRIEIMNTAKITRNKYLIQSKFTLPDSFRHHDCTFNFQGDFLDLSADNQILAYHIS
jgi:hypothetical protein